ncbi:putative membrane protein [Desulfosporosinus orientis DSM 765]|uniref:Putative membrane protein n=1 Tax=Desulfosporosinus orientis (strain ATCC 19365 / DSM 765 / NCIMB 8382 / VKM B-1628 / Singapore I) TaxID=768706 RepID=G7WA53_DESOD|nr:ECF transporter S component [Desulfosporosinus orientis]AET66191.1 putative membrane protein [Desulfosporosinus orientis DSM 765]
MQGLCLNRYKKAATLGTLILIPSLLVLSALKGDRNYALLSVVVIMAAMVPFFLRFEKRNPQARELVAIAVMAGLAALGRVAFAPIPNFKPITAIIIIAGVAFGPEAGFLTGAVAAATSNLFFGQGPWTPWQMFCWGMIGFGAGLLRNSGLLKGKYSLAAYGLLSGFVFGWIMNLWYIIGFINPITWQAITAAYISSFWFDLTHALSTLVFVLVLAGPWLKKLNRLKVKFGLLE